MIALERLFDNSVAQRNFEKLGQLVPDTGGTSVGIRFGTGTVPFTLAAQSSSNTITHGLGVAPVAVFLTSRNNKVSYAVTARSATTITVLGFVTDNTTMSGTKTFEWMVIG